MSGQTGRVDEIQAQFRDVAQLTERVSIELAPEIETLVDKIVRVFAAGGKLLFAGNGGSAADAQHLAAEYVVRFTRERRPLPAMALTTDSSVLTAQSNDVGFETVFSRQVAALGRAGDLLILHSTSGDSENLIRAASAARDQGMESVAFLGRSGGRLKSEVGQALIVPTEIPARAQELHMIIGHVVCDLVEETIQEDA